MEQPATTTGTGTRGRPLDVVFACLADRDRRDILGIVSDRDPDPVSREDLTAALAARRASSPRDGPTPEEREGAAIALQHLHLPKLSAAGLVSSATDDAVRLGDHDAFRDQGILDVVEGDALSGCQSLDALFRALATERRRTVLDVLSHQFGPIHVETLARELGGRDDDARLSEVSDDLVDRIMGNLHHVALPVLSDAGLIQHDTDERTVAYEGHPQLRVPWMHSVLEPDFRRSLTGESDTAGIGEIEGREAVVSFGQSLCDRADEELFCMFTDTGMLEAGCLTRIRDASHRGTTVYLGTRDPEIREYIRENAPEVILWEPNTDWLNLPAAGDSVGRLLLADRETVMLGTLLDRQRDGVQAEQAIVGEGEHDTLVTMICQLLEPHLAETEKDDDDDIEARLPL